MPKLKKAVDIEIDETEDLEEEEEDQIKYEISYYPTDLTLKGYLNKWEADQIRLPEFQRKYVWDQVQASKLVESFLLGLPVPGVFLYKERATNKLLIIDGQQRIFSVIKYFKNKFDDKSFRLKKVSPKWNNKTYDELEESDRLLLDDSVLRATVVQQLDPQDDSSIYYIFERLNTGGMKLNPMEIRKCVYYGPVLTMLETLNKNKHWRLIVGNAREDKRLRDVEFVLRFLSMREGWSMYEKPMKAFLNNYMISKSKLTDSVRDKYIDNTKKMFVKTCASIYNMLGEKPFHLRGRLNYAVMDSCMTVISQIPSVFGAKHVAGYKKLLKNLQYLEAVSISTSDAAVVKKRFHLASKYIL